MAPKHAWAALLTSKCSGKTLNLRVVVRTQTQTQLSCCTVHRTLYLRAPRFGEVKTSAVVDHDVDQLRYSPPS
jgi:hypothetical protein